ncbi:unnamed protein product [Didymodactylos carnosus]|uniref:C2H2-type domain-containing protein n=1 Tax=Didymodactylos carnosus TaxID=1234261 RepID=A0A814CDE0_9BILA|nr:unnamed protein product [Didymodactylos carnosus]CAF1109035.1 unnamed protein product [Didymodactylos carnosus]CAF3716555.1 unnamed protein product [Didymodactylos carnosus]CAF3875155.1 unnamed protein product [Didymodactylos carnosus]
MTKHCRYHQTVVNPNDGNSDDDDSCIIEDDDSYPTPNKKKRKLEKSGVRINPSIVDWSKKNRNRTKEHPKPSTQSFVSNTVNELVLDPNEYIFEAATSPPVNSYEAFDWTKQLSDDNRSKRTRKKKQFLSKNYPLSPPKIINHTHQQQILGNSQIQTLSNLVQPSLHSTSTNVILAPSGEHGTNTIPLVPMPAFNQYLEKNNEHISILPLNHNQTSSSSSLFGDYHVPQERRQLKTYSAYTMAAAAKKVQQKIQEPPISSKTTNTHNLITESQKNVLNGQGVFSAFHDTHYYRCNICTYKTINSSSLLHHLFTHMFFCTQCCYYTYSRLQYYQHCHTEHAQTTLSLENTNKNMSITYDFNLMNPENFDHLYVTRCNDGTFALCMDSSVNVNEDDCQIISSTKKQSNDGQKLETNPTPVKSQDVSLPTLPAEICHDSDDELRLFNKNASRDKTIQDINIPLSFQQQQSPRTDRHQPKQSPPPPPPAPQTDNEDILLLDNVVSPPSPVKEKLTRAYVSMKHRRSFCNKQQRSLQSLTLEYAICKEQTIRQMCRTNKQKRRRKKVILTTTNKLNKLLFTNKNNEIVSCINNIIDSMVYDKESEVIENVSQPPFVSYLPNKILASVLSSDDIQILDSLNLINKYDLQINEEKQIASEQPLRSSDRHVFILSSPNKNKSVELLLSPNSATYTPYLYTKLAKLPANKDNTDKFLRKSITHPLQSQLSLSTETSTHTTHKKQRKKKKPSTFYPSMKLPHLPSLPSTNHSNCVDTTQRNLRLLRTTSKIKSPTRDNNNNKIRINHQCLNVLEEQVIILD